MIAAFPLQWPEGWPRTDWRQRKSANWSKRERTYRGPDQPDEVRDKALTLADGVGRVLVALERFGVDRQDAVISTNVRTRLDGFPRSGEPAPDDPGVAVYWQEANHGAPRVMAIDIYDSVAGNLGAVAATLDAMRAIERHGGAKILERAFTGFTALPDPNAKKTWRDVLGYQREARPTLDDLRARYRSLAQERHPDRGGSEQVMAELNVAREQAETELRP